MKNTIRTIGIIMGIMVIAFAAVGCKTTTFTEAQSGRVYNVAFGAKNIDILNVVYVETKVDKKGNGAKITYDALLKEAVKAGGNGIANIMIDKKVTQTGFSKFIKDREETWYGSALAIRYTNAPATSPISEDTTSLQGGGFSLLRK